MEDKTKKTWDRAFAYAMQLALSRQRAEEFAQECAAGMIGPLKKQPLNYALIDFLRKSSGRKESKVYEKRRSLLAYVPIENTHVKDSYEDQLKVIKEYLDFLPEKERVLAYLFYFYDATMLEIAQIYQCTDAAIFWRLKKIKRKMIKEFREKEAAS